MIHVNDVSVPWRRDGGGGKEGHPAPYILHCRKIFFLPENLLPKYKDFGLESSILAEFSGEIELHNTNSFLCRKIATVSMFNGRRRCVSARQITSGHAVFNADVEKEIECRSHCDEPVRFYCDDCESCVCVLCTFHGHRGHRVMSFHDAAARQRCCVSDLLERCRRRVTDVDALLGALDRCDKHITDTEQIIHQAASAFTQVDSANTYKLTTDYVLLCAHVNSASYLQRDGK